MSTIKLYAVLVYHNGIYCASYYNLNDVNILYRNSIKKQIRQTIDNLLEHINTNLYAAKETIGEIDIQVLYYSGYLVITSDTYPNKVALQLIHELLAGNDLNETCCKYRGLENTIIQELDETKEILLQTIEKIIERGEKLEDLLERTHDISIHSRDFKKQSEKLNSSCCTIL